ncbi:glycosyltransferase [Zafaria sp. J156]|uniref:glycosyltransferase n=1 Tax=Zafaria sp. J156 TaxID=3116490 RepID=UPI002E760B17|nr:glycosyltransferase [Zafaria sp. J156]MEE1620058.1 glycosyltransferase [Zafaria sp. J156]
MDRPLHIAMFVDQHPQSLGGMQTSVRLQRKYLERLGHQVSVVAPPARHGQPEGAAVIELPGFGVRGSEYSVSLPGRRADRVLDEALAGSAPVDVVHVQADFWQAATGYRFAHRHRLPVVHTMHNRLDVGLRATVPFPDVVERAMGPAMRAMLPGPTPPARDAWGYLRVMTERAAVVTAPSSHFARLLEERGVFDSVRVVPNGFDDDLAAELLSVPRPQRSGRPRLVWIGRFSPEKRLLPFLDAVRRSGIDAEVHVFGDGAERARAEAAVRGLTTPDVVFRGTVPYAAMLGELRAADALVQTSLGFETQGMTVFEAAALGTPTILSDARIAEDLPPGSFVQVPSGQHADDVEPLATALRSSVAALKDGRLGRVEGIDPEAVLQSRQTRLMLDAYVSVLVRR